MARRTRFSEREKSSRDGSAPSGRGEERYRAGRELALSEWTNGSRRSGKSVDEFSQWQLSRRSEKVFLVDSRTRMSLEYDGRRGGKQVGPADCAQFESAPR